MTYIIHLWATLRAILRRHTGWIGEIVTVPVTTVSIIAFLTRAHDAPLLPSLRVLDLALPDEYWIALATIGVAVQILGLAVIWSGRRWVRFCGAVLMSGWWLNMAWAASLAVGTPLHQGVAAYAGYAALNIYAVLTLLEADT